MKKGAFLLFVVLMTATTLVFQFQRGCGTALSTIAQFLGWKIVRLMYGPVASDTHEHVVSFVGAAISSFFVAAVLISAVLLARRRGHLLRTRGVTVVYITGVAIYLVLLLLAFPLENCA